MPAVMKQGPWSYLSAAGYSNGQIIGATEMVGPITTGNFASVASPEIDNSLFLWSEGDFLLDITFASAPTAGGIVSLYAFPSADSVTGSAFTAPAFNDYALGNLWVASFQVAAVTTQQILWCPKRRLPNSKFKVVLKNGTSQSTPTTATVKLFASNWQSV